MKQPFDNFCTQVLKHIPRATRSEREEIREELLGHLEDKAEALREKGIEEADAAAVDAMGNAGEIGSAWNEQFSTLWLWVGRLAMVLVVVFALYCVTPVITRGMILVENLGARFGTLENYADSDLHLIGMTSMDERISLDDHIIRFYRARVEYDQDGEGYVLMLHCVGYAKNPFGLEPDFFSLQHITCDGQEGTFGGGSGSPGACYWATQFPVTAGDDSVEIVIEHYGQTFSMEAELDWGGEADE